MHTSRGPSRWHRVVLFSVVPFVLVVLMPTAGAVADEVSPAPPGGTGQPPAPGQGSPGTPGPAPAGDPLADDPSPTEEPAPAEEPAPTEEPASPEVPSEAPGSDVGTEAPEGEPESGFPTSPDPAADEQAAAELTEEPTSGVAAQQLSAPEPKVTICHRTNSPTNPYNQIAVTESSAIEGHAGHRGPVFRPGLDNWGDIIPPIRPGLPRGRNWPAGRGILDNGCEMKPDVGPVPSATGSGVECVGTTPVIVGTLRNDADATAAATYEILVDGVVVETAGPVPPGASQTVVLTGAPGGALDGLEDQTVTVAVRSGGEILASEVVTIDCVPGSPDVAIVAELACDAGAAQGTVTATDNGPDPVEVSVTVDGTPVGTPVTVDPGTTETGTTDLSGYEDQTITVAILVDGAVAASYTVTPDCVAPRTDPRVSVAGQECPPPSTTVTLANDGDPDSRVVFVIRINGRVVQVSAPIYGGDTTTIVGDLSRFEDQTVTVAVRANGQLLGRRTITVDCEQPGTVPGGDTGPNDALPAGRGATGPTVLPSVGADVSPGLLALGLGLVAAGGLLVAQPNRGARTRSGPRCLR